MPPVQSRLVERLSMADEWRYSKTLNRTTLVKAALIFAIASAVYFITRSPGLDEIDSVNFAQGVRHFDVWNHQPQPPGYPLYIALGKLAVILFGATPELSLHLVSAIGGGLFIAAWFLIIRAQFTERLAWWVTSCLAVMPGVWMTTTKVLSDSLAAGLLSAEILAAIYVSKGRSRAYLFATALLGAAAAGARPQLILVVFIILAIALRQRRPGTYMSIFAWSTLVAGSLLWLIPMWYTQWRLRPDVSGWLVYPKLVYQQWSWRYDKPDVFIGAGNWTPHYLATRVCYHFLGWFGLGFGFLASWLALAAGAVIVLFGVSAYASWHREASDGQFWRFHLPWAIVHVAIIFICLPETTRYYLVIFPLLLVVILRGLHRLAAPWKWASVALVALLLYTAIPLVIANHGEDAPALRFVHFLQTLYPPETRGRVVLLLSNKTKKHADWYAPEFKTISLTRISSTDQVLKATKDAAAVYTDDPKFALPKDWYRVPLARFDRSLVIYLKGHIIFLYLVANIHSS